MRSDKLVPHKHRGLMIGWTLAAVVVVGLGLAACVPAPQVVVSPDKAPLECPTIPAELKRRPGLMTPDGVFSDETQSELMLDLADTLESCLRQKEAIIRIVEGSSQVHGG